MRCNLVTPGNSNRKSNNNNNNFKRITNIDIDVINLSPVDKDGSSSNNNSDVNDGIFNVSMVDRTTEVCTLNIDI